METKEKLLKQWKQEAQAGFTGWDFSHIRGRVRDESPPWGYRKQAHALLQSADAALDMDTGGGELLSELAPFPERMCAIEAYEPNIPLARKRLEPLGIEFRAQEDQDVIPFEDASFDLVLNRHGYYNEEEVSRVLRPGGIFFTQQVSGDDLKGLPELFGAERMHKEWNLSRTLESLGKAGMEIVHSEEWKGNMRFLDVGALVYYLKAIPWVVPGFSVDTHEDVLYALEEQRESGKPIVFKKSRFLLRARKK